MRTQTRSQEPKVRFSDFLISVLDLSYLNVGLILENSSRPTIFRTTGRVRKKNLTRYGTLYSKPCQLYLYTFARSTKTQRVKQPRSAPRTNSTSSFRILLYQVNLPYITTMETYADFPTILIPINSVLKVLCYGFISFFLQSSFIRLLSFIWRYVIFRDQQFILFNDNSRFCPWCCILIEGVCPFSSIFHSVYILFHSLSTFELSEVLRSALIQFPLQCYLISRFTGSLLRCMIMKFQ